MEAGRFLRLSSMKSAACKSALDRFVGRYRTSHFVAQDGCSFEGEGVLSCGEFAESSEQVVDGRAPGSFGPMTGSLRKWELREGRIADFCESDRRFWSNSLVGCLNPRPLLGRCFSTSEERATTVLSVEEEEVVVVRDQAVEIGGPYSLDLPRIENRTADVINGVCKVLGGREWGPDIEAQLEDMRVVFTPFLIQQTVRKLSLLENAEQAWSFFKWAREKAGRKVSVSAHVSILETLGRAKNFELMKQAFAFVLEDGHTRSAWPYNIALKWCSVAKDVGVAQYFWSKMMELKCKPTVATYTRYMDLLSRQGLHQEALETFRQMLKANCPPNISTYNVLIHAFGAAGQPEVASSLFDKLAELGCKPNHTTYKNLMVLHVRAGKPEMALKYYNLMKAAGMNVADDISKMLHTSLPKTPAVDEVAYTEETVGSETGETEDKQSAFVGHLDIDFSLPGPSTGRVITPASLVKMLEKGERLSVEARLEKIRPSVNLRFVVQVLQRLKNPDTAMTFFNWAKTRPDYQHNQYAYCVMINILGRTRSHEALDGILKEMQEQGITMNTPIFTSLITCYGRAKSVDGALKVFEQMKEWGCKPDVITYTSLIHLLAKHGKYELAMNKLEEMQQAGVAGNTRTYSVVIYNLVKAGKVNEAVALLNKMPGLGCPPSAITFATIIDHCAKEGNLAVAKDLYSLMEASEIKPLRKTITVLDAALRKGGRIEEADKLLARFGSRRVWDETYKSSTEKVAQELLLKDLVKDELDPQSNFVRDAPEMESKTDNYGSDLEK